MGMMLFDIKMLELMKQMGISGGLEHERKKLALWDHGTAPENKPSRLENKRFAMVKKRRKIARQSKRKNRR